MDSENGCSFLDGDSLKFTLESVVVGMNWLHLLIELFIRFRDRLDHLEILESGRR